MSQQKVCRTEDEVVAALGTVCAVVGTYDVKPFTNKKGEVMKQWPVVILDEGTRPVLIESLWDESKAPSAETLATYRGKRVEIVGMLHAMPPGDSRMANMAVPCVSPVESLRALQ